MDPVPSAEYRTKCLLALKQRLEKLLADVDALGLAFVGIQLSQAIEGTEQELISVQIGPNTVKQQETSV